MGLATEVVPQGSAVERALALGETLAGFPWATLIADRQSALEAQGLPLADGLAVEAERGATTVELGALGAERFSSGEGRHGASIPPTFG